MTHIHIPAKLRFLLAFCLALLALTIIYVKNNSRQKKDYAQITGRLLYLDSKMGDLPIRDPGRYRYIKIENYPYPFEIYADEQGAKMDSLKVGDTVTAYYYETGNTKEERVNRFLQYLEKGNKFYFERTDFAIQLGYCMIGILLVSMFLFYLLYKKGKIQY